MAYWGSTFFLLFSVDVGFKHTKLAQIEARVIKSVSRHIYFMLFLLVTNPQIHALIVYQNPCATNFISAAVFKQCHNNPLENRIPFVERLPFLILELYRIVMWQYMVSFMWAFIFFALIYLEVELEKMEKVT